MSHRLGLLDNLRGRGITLLLLEVDLRAFKGRDITPEKLNEVRAAFAAARRHELKVVVRTAYGFTGRDDRADPKDLGRILGHIRQLGAVFRGERDVLYAVQAGILGPLWRVARVQLGRLAFARGAPWSPACSTRCPGRSPCRSAGRCSSGTSSPASPAAPD
jgi:hypothetical protein